MRKGKGCGRGCGSVQAAANGRKGKQKYEAKVQASRNKKKLAAYEAGIDTGRLTADLPPLPTVQRIWGQGGRPYYRPGSLDAWPELKASIECAENAPNLRSKARNGSGSG